MRILLLAQVHREKEYLKENGKLPFPRFQAHNAWLRAFETLGYKVSIFKYTDSILMPSVARVYLKDFFEKLFPIWTSRFFRIKSKLYFLSLENLLRNRKLLSLAHRSKPNLIIISGGLSSIYPSTIKRIKDRYDAQVLLFSGVNPKVAATLVERILVKKRIADIVVENDRGYAKNWKKLGAKKTIVLPISSVDPKIHKKIKLSNKEKKEYSCDVCFAGTLMFDRQQALSKLLDLDIKIWGDIPIGTKLDKKLKSRYCGTAFGEKMVKIFNAAKIVLNFQPKDMTHGGNMRTFEIPGCHAFQLADRIDPDFLTNGRDYVSFTNIQDIKAKIKYYLQNESKRLRIAESGAKRAYQGHTYEKHFKKLLSQI